MGADSISSVLSIVTLGVAIMIGGIAQTDWKHKVLVNSLIGGGLLIVLLGLSFPWLRDWAPKAGDFIGGIATNPASWFCVVVLLFCMQLVVDARKPRSLGDLPEKAEIQRLWAALERAANHQIEANNGIQNMIGLVDDKADKIAMNVQADIQGLSRSIDNLSKKVDDQHEATGRGQLRLAHSLRARDALEIIRPADGQATELGSRLATAEQSDYANDMAWLADYTKWKDALSIVDTIVGHWQQDHRPFLNVSAHEVERVQDMPPPNISSERTITQFKRLCLVNERYQQSREGVMNWFREKTSV